MSGTWLPPGLRRDLAALSEGRCPQHGTALRVTGWCARCQCWWRADFRESLVTTVYPFPGVREPES